VTSITVAAIMAISFGTMLFAPETVDADLLSGQDAT
jgi:hypothetical protein